MSRVMLIGVMAVAASWFSSADVFAQRDAGAKVRGDQRAFWDSGSGAYQGRSYSFGIRDADAGRRFSYEPIGIRAGDMVTVNRDNVNVMRGTNIVGSLANGMQFKVSKVVDGWLGVVTEVDGKVINGWVRHEHVSAVTTKSEDSVKEPAAKAPARSERRFSYEPAVPSRPTRTFESKRNSWDYPKTDPRRFRP